MKKHKLIIVFLCFVTTIIAQKKQSIFKVISPNNKIVLNISIGKKISWSVNHEADSFITPSAISLQLENGAVLGNDATIISSKTEIINEIFKAINYKKAMVLNNCSQLQLNFKGNYGIVFRAYDDGVAYRFFVNGKDSLIIKNEEANFNFNKDYISYVPYVRELRGKEQFIQSYEALYTKDVISKVWIGTTSLWFHLCTILPKKQQNISRYSIITVCTSQLDCKKHIQTC